IQKLRAEKLATEDDVVRGQEDIANQRLRLADLDLQLFQMNLTRVKAEDTYAESRNRITQREDTVLDLHEEVEELTTRVSELDRLSIEGDFSRQLELSELERAIQGFEKELAESREIRSDHDGRILELTSGEGKMVVRGQRLGTVDVRTDQALEAMACFTLKD